MTTHATINDQARDAWDALAPRFDQYTTSAWSMPLGEHALRYVGIRPGVRFLDVATGCGALAIPAARKGADVTAVDLSSVMIERLSRRSRTEQLPNLHGMVMSGESLEFGDNTFDLAASQNGVSTFPDLWAGLGEIVRVTKPGGQVMIVTFGRLDRAEFLRFFIGAVQACVPDFRPMPADPPPLPFRLADPATFTDVLSAAGLDDVRVETLTWPTRFHSAAHFWDVVTSGKPIAAQLADELTDAQRRDVCRVLDGMLRERSAGGAGAVLRVDMNMGVGTKPRHRAS